MGAKKLKVICDYCGKEFCRNPAQLKYKNHFCSRYCAGQFMKGKTYTIKKKITNEEIKITKVCIVCGKDISFRGNRSVRCKECQKYYHNASRRAKRKRKYLNCISCGIDIRSRDYHAMYCYDCARKRNIESAKKYNKSHRDICQRAQQKYYKKNKVKINRRLVIYKRERRRKLKQRKYNNIHYKKNEEHILKRKKIWTKNNRDKINASRKKWYQKNIDRCKEYSRKYREKQKGKVPTKICIDKTCVTVLSSKEYDGVLGEKLIEKYMVKK